MEKTVFEQMGGSYVRQGDYELPAINLLPEETHIGVWGQRYRRWLKANHCVLYYNLLTSGKLNEQMAEVDERAETMFLRLVKEFAKREGVTEDLKATNMMAWIGHMNSIRQRAIELVIAEIFTA